ncbi:MAG: ATP-binding cassette domain-containing protein [Acidimicrobiales bacterium]
MPEDMKKAGASGPPGETALLEAGRDLGTGGGIAGKPGNAGQAPLLSIRGVSKHFGPVRAVDSVSLDIYPQEVLGLIGDNGAGKSTFLSLLTGYNRADEGTFFYKGQPVSIGSPRESRNRLRIEMIYQQLQLARDLTVWENLFLGEEMRLFGFVSDRRSMRKRAAAVLERLNSKIRPNDLLGNLSGGEQQLVAIGRAILFDRDIILMDEPTAAISAAKVDDLLQLVRDLKALGKTVILVSHRLEDILAVADGVAVLVLGRLHCVVPNENLSVAGLVHLMFGGEAQAGASEPSVAAARWRMRHGTVEAGT